MEKGEKVFVLVHEVVYDGDSQQSIQVYGTLEDAINAKKDIVKFELTQVDSDWEIDDDDLSFEAYEKYFYCERHTCVTIYEQVVR